MTVTAPTSRARVGRARGHRRLDRRTRRAEPETFELCMALLEEAIARAERWFASRERALAELDRRAVDAVRQLRSAGMLGPSATRDLS